MPPVTKAGGTQFRKDVEFAATKDSDEYELEAVGIVMVPDKADLQHDFAREDTIRGFADQFETFVEAGEAGGGIMHAVFPDDWMDLVRNGVLDESEEIGGKTAPAGSWVQRWGIANADLAALIDEGILAGYSIGAVQVDWNGPFEHDEVDDVAVPDDLGEDALVWELTDGLIREVSTVDIPAVPDAQILETKAGAEKRLGDYLGDPDGFLEEAQQRGHTEAEAEQLWEVLNDAVAVEGSSDPGEKTVFHRIGKAAVDTFLGNDDEKDVGAVVGETSTTDPRPSSASKEGRTLSAANRESAMAAVDANLDILEDAGVDHGLTRFTDRDNFDFDLSEHQARDWADDDDETGNEDEDEDEAAGDDGEFWEPAVEDGTEGFQHSETGEFVPVDEADADIMADINETESASNHASGGETPDDDGTNAPNTTDMSNNDDPTDGEDKSLAEQNAEQINDLTQAVESLTETLSGPEQKTAEIEIDGETYEVPEEQVKSALGVDEDAGVSVADAIESLKSQVNEQQRRLDAINRQSGVSTQLERNAGNPDGEDGGDSLDEVGKALT